MVLVATWVSVETLIPAARAATMLSSSPVVSSLSQADVVGRVAEQPWAGGEPEAGCEDYERGRSQNYEQERQRSEGEDEEDVAGDGGAAAGVAPDPGAERDPEHQRCRLRG